MGHGSVQQRYSDALDALVETVKQDRSILAAMLCGSLSHDRVWSKSDIDLVLITIDDRKIESSERALYADGINVHAFLLPRAKFRAIVEGTLRNSFLHALLAKGRLLYTHDESLADLVAQLGRLGARDSEVLLLGEATQALALLYKAHKWLVTRGDLEYTALYILLCATPIAKLEVIGAGRIADREVIPQACEIAPELMRVIYRDLLNYRKTTRAVQAALDTLDRYLAERAPRLFALLLDHLREVGEARSATELEDHFARNFGVEGVTTACEYLADQGMVGKASTTVQLTRRSNTGVQELAFFHLAEAAGKPAPNPTRNATKKARSRDR
jgi:predicted nucleotidyltransferase